MREVIAECADEAKAPSVGADYLALRYVAAFHNSGILADPIRLYEWAHTEPALNLTPGRLAERYVYAIVELVKADMALDAIRLMIERLACNTSGTLNNVALEADRNVFVRTS